MARLHYNKRIPIIKNLLYLNFSTGRGWSLSFGPPGTKVNYGINDHKKQVSFGKGGFRYRKTLSDGNNRKQTNRGAVRRRPPEEKIDHMISKHVQKNYDLSKCTMQSFNFEGSAWPHGIQITHLDGHKELVYWDYHTNQIYVYRF
jgi:hypothetical protein